MTTPWDQFFREKIAKIFTEKRRVIDIGGGLRIAREKNNRYDRARAWIVPLAEKVEYLVLDPVPDYHPDLVGDIHHLPFEDASGDALIAIAVLEHVEDPAQAVRELYRVLRPGGYCFVYVPFLYYYHAELGYYKDYWRYTKDTLDLLFKDFSHRETQSVRGPVGTLVRLTPLGRTKKFDWLWYVLDRMTGKLASNQVSGYYLFATK